MNKLDFTKKRQMAGFANQKDLAEYLGVTEATLSTWINKNRVPKYVINNLYNLIKIKYLEATIEILKS